MLFAKMKEIILHMKLVAVKGRLKFSLSEVCQVGYSYKYVLVKTLID